MRAAHSRLRGRRSQTSRGGPSRFSKVLQQGWSRGDSNPGPPPCKGGALPAKLRPPIRSSVSHLPVGAPGLEPGTSALSGPRSHHLSYAPVIRARSAGRPSSLPPMPAAHPDRLARSRCRRRSRSRSAPAPTGAPARRWHPALPPALFRPPGAPAGSSTRGNSPRSRSRSSVPRRPASSARRLTWDVCGPSCGPRP